MPDLYYVKQIINRMKVRNQMTSKPEGMIAPGLFSSIVKRSKGCFIGSVQDSYEEQEF